MICEEQLKTTLIKGIIINGLVLQRLRHCHVYVDFLFIALCRLRDVGIYNSRE